MRGKAGRPARSGTRTTVKSNRRRTSGEAPCASDSGDGSPVPGDGTDEEPYELAPSTGRTHLVETAASGHPETTTPVERYVDRDWSEADPSASVMDPVRSDERRHCSWTGNRALAGDDTSRERSPTGPVAPADSRASAAMGIGSTFDRIGERGTSYSDEQ